MSNFKLTIEYDGTRYCGWQRQKNDPTIQGTIEWALHTLTREPVVLNGSGRTDSGVHALAQVASFSSLTRIPPDALMRGLNSLLPEDIVIRDCVLAPDDFHARFSVKKKRYRYQILNQPVRAALGRHYAWHIRAPLDVSAMRDAARHVVGTHDFKSFEGAGSPRAHSVRTVFQTEVEETDPYLVFGIQADGFLRFMVRNIVGTLVAVGLGKITPRDFSAILAAEDRGLAGPTAPARGLFLAEVLY